MCGEKSTGILVWLEVIGSPPRMRGKAARLCLFSFFLGIAPAYAGKRLASAVVPPSSEDHPRVCGEKNVKMLKSKWKLGSPPRMRGKVGVVKLLFELPMDHPRVCGEKLLLYSRYKPCKGSPPRMRGKARESPASGRMTGITPAYAGKRSVEEDVTWSIRDHPRVCGEKLVRLAFICGIWGSPPRMRGKDELANFISHRKWITPAYAGKSAAAQILRHLYGDHPRVCGEKPADYVGYKLAQGSPPRMRGKAHAAPWGVNTGGITPAYAGKRRLGVGICVVHQDHPRVCGEKTKKIP